MKKRFTVRKHPTLGKFGYWCAWDTTENRVARDYPDKASATWLTRYLNKLYKEVQA